MGFANSGDFQPGNVPCGGSVVLDMLQDQRVYVAPARKGEIIRMLRIEKVGLRTLRFIHSMWASLRQVVAIHKDAPGQETNDRGASLFPGYLLATSTAQRY
jgi:hypothetical protein